MFGAPPHAGGDPNANPPPAVAATFGVRAGAQIIDTIFGFILSFVIVFPMAVVIAVLAQTGSIAPTWQAKMNAITAGSVVVSIVGTTLYHATCESIGGATLGKWICGLRVRSAVFSPDGTFLRELHSCSFGAALIRSLAFLVDAMFCGAVAYVTMSNSAWQQRLGDQWGKTVVVQAKSMADPGKSPIIGVLVGVVTWGVFILLSVAVKFL
jgi:uncharacterized RDD family membrane protein YckC